MREDFTLFIAVRGTCLLGLAFTVFFAIGDEQAKHRAPSPAPVTESLAPQDGTTVIEWREVMVGGLVLMQPQPDSTGFYRSLVIPPGSILYFPVEVPDSHPACRKDA